MDFNQIQTVIVLVLTGKRFYLGVVELCGIGRVFKGLGNRLPWRSATLQFDNDQVSLSVKGKQINGST